MLKFPAIFSSHRSFFHFFRFFFLSYIYSVLFIYTFSGPYQLLSHFMFSLLLSDIYIHFEENNIIKKNSILYHRGNFDEQYPRDL